MTLTEIPQGKGKGTWQRFHNSDGGRARPDLADALDRVFARAKVDPVEWYEQTAPNVRTKFRRTSLGVVRTDESIVTPAGRADGEKA